MPLRGCITMIYLTLFLEFFKVGLFAVGGGLATLPFLQQIALKYPWFTPDDLLDMIAVSESTPGPIGVNAATYAGFHAAGLAGAIVATFSLVLPSVIIILLISRALARFRDSQMVKDMFYGLRPASAGLILGAMFSVFAGSLFYTTAISSVLSLVHAVNWAALLGFICLSVAVWRFKKLHPIVIILAGALWGIVFQL